MPVLRSASSAYVSCRVGGNWRMYSRTWPPTASNWLGLLGLRPAANHSITASIADGARSTSSFHRASASAPPARDLVPGQVQAEDHASFYIGGGFGRVDVLALLVLADGPGREGERLAALVADRDDQALGEEIGPVAAHQSGLLSVGQRPLLGPQLL